MIDKWHRVVPRLLLSTSAKIFAFCWLLVPIPIPIPMVALDANWTFHISPPQMVLSESADPQNQTKYMTPNAPKQNQPQGDISAQMDLTDQDTPREYMQASAIRTPQQIEMSDILGQRSQVYRVNPSP